MYGQGWVDQDEAAMSVVGHAPAEDEPINKPVEDVNKPKEEDPEPGSKRMVTPREVERFRAVMDRSGYGRLSEWYRPNRKPSLDADERIVAVQRNGLTQTTSGNVYYGWDIYFRVDGVQPKGGDAPLAGIPSEVEVTDDDAGRAIALWDREIPEYEGMLDATPV